MTTFINVIIPTYNASGTIRTLVEQLEKERSSCDFHILLVDDASTDDTREIIRALAEEHSNIDYSFAERNRGQQASLHTGLKMISKPCDYVITMDDDLQNPVDVIPSLIETIRSGYDLVYAVPATGRNTSDPVPSFIRRMGSRVRDQLFDSFPNKPAGIKVSAFRILSYDLAVKIARSQKKYFYLSAEAFQFDIRTANIAYEYVPRPCGRSSYRLGKLLLIYFRILLSYKLPVLR